MKNKRFIYIVLSLIILAFFVGFSYAWYTPLALSSNSALSNQVSSGTLVLTYNGSDYFLQKVGEPGDTESMTFTVTNYGTLPVNSYLIYFSELINTFTNNEMVYEISCSSSDAITCSEKGETVVPTENSIALVGSSIAPGTTHTYVMDVTFNNKISGQDYNQGQKLSFKININSHSEYSDNRVPTYIMTTYGSNTSHFWAYKASITSVTFEDKIDVPSGATSWNVEASGYSPIKAYIIDDGLGTSTYKLYIQSDNLIYANPNSSTLFYGFTNLKTINNFNLFITNNVTNMGEMFYNCTSLLTLNLSNFNTTNVTNMYRMFRGCNDLVDIDFGNSNFSTAKVTSMTQMFYQCYDLITLNLSIFNSTDLLTLDYMFAYCSNLANIVFGSSFTTVKVNTMKRMFYECNSIKSIDVSMFNTAEVLDMENMFGECHLLEELDLSNFNTAKTTDVSYMFSSCNSIQEIDLRNASFGVATTYGNMFAWGAEDFEIIINSGAQTFINARLTDVGINDTVTVTVV